MPDDSALLSVLQGLRERGALGEASLPDAVRHAEAFVAAMPPSTRRVIDLGSGGGLPGLVLAARLPHAAFVFADRRERRMDLVQLACVRLGLTDRVTVLTGDVVALSRRDDLRGTFDVVTARAFGDPLTTVRAARPFLGEAGVVIVSEPPDLADSPPADEAVSARWPAAALAALGLRLSSTTHPLVRRIEQAGQRNS
jgi:16S rRNA (guanine527-N7)-methyltransferase